MDLSIKAVCVLIFLSLEILLTLLNLSVGIPVTQKGLLHRRYTDVQKLKVAEYARHHGLRPAERKFGIHRRNIAQWLEHRLVEVKEKKKRKRSNRPGQGRKLSYPVELDEQLVQWVLEMRDLQVAISSEMLKQNARLLIRPVQPSFKCSSG